MVLSENILKPSVEKNSFHPVLSIASKIISYIFHPLFVPLYVVLFLLYEARLFPDKDAWQKTIVVIQFFVSYTLLPLATILLMKALGFIQSVFLKTQKDRILPYVVCEIYYFWAWYVSKNLFYPKQVILFALGIFLAACIGLILNSYIKISMHALSVGVVAAFILLCGLKADINYGPYITVAFLIAGITATSRMINSNHTSKEIYTGFFAGALMQALAYFFV